MISIVTPSYRQLDWLRLAVASVKDQSGVEVEHIVQDAGTDGIKELFDEATSRHPVNYHPYLIVETDAGMYDAINRGLARARGDICAYLNCDEQYLPGALARISEFFAKSPEIDIVFGDMILVDQEGVPLSYRRMVRPTLHHTAHAHLNTATCSMFFRRSLFERGFHFDPAWKTIGDAVWVTALLRARIRMSTLPAPLAIFTQTGGNLGAAGLSRAEIERWKSSHRTHSLSTAAAVFWLRVRKLFAGAYRTRKVEVDIFTSASPEKRQKMAATVGFGWVS